MNKFDLHVNSKLRIVLTGASRGIGAEIAQALAPYAEWICLVGRDEKALRHVQTMLSDIKSEVIVGDISLDGVHDRIVASVPEGGLDVLINNAGVSEFGNVESCTPASVEQLVAVNLMAPIVLTQRLLPALRARVSGQIINIGSTFSYIGYPGFAVYSASKFGLRGFTESLDRELAGSNVRARIFSPRATSTDINAPHVKSLNRELGVHEDSPRQVAAQFASFLFNTNREGRVGLPERVFSRLNQLFPWVVDRALRSQMPRIRKAFSVSHSAKG